MWGWGFVSPSKRFLRKALSSSADLSLDFSSFWARLTISRPNNISDEWKYAIWFLSGFFSLNVIGWWSSVISELTARVVTILLQRGSVDLNFLMYWKLNSIFRSFFLDKLLNARAAILKLGSSLSCAQVQSKISGETCDLSYSNPPNHWLSHEICTMGRRIKSFAAGPFEISPQQRSLSSGLMLG